MIAEQCETTKTAEERHINPGRLAAKKDGDDERLCRHQTMK